MSEISEIKLSYNRLSALLVAIANAFTLAYVGQMNLYDAVWYGSVSGAFTFVILSNANMDHYDWDARRGASSRSDKPQSLGYPMPQQFQQPMPQMPQQQMPQQQMQQPEEYLPQAPVPKGKGKK